MPYLPRVAGRRVRGTARGWGAQGTHGTVFTGGAPGHAHSHPHTHTHTDQGLGTHTTGTGARRLVGRWGQRLRVRGAGRFPARPELGTHLPQFGTHSGGEAGGHGEGAQGLPSS